MKPRIIIFLLAVLYADWRLIKHVCRLKNDLQRYIFCHFVSGLKQKVSVSKEWEMLPSAACSGSSGFSFAHLQQRQHFAFACSVLNSIRLNGKHWPQDLRAIYSTAPPLEEF